MTSTFSIIVPSMGRADLLDCLLDSLATTTQLPKVEVCIGLDPSGEPRYSDDVNTRLVGRIARRIAGSPGMSAAVNAAFAASRGEWLIFVPDDIVFLQGWDEFGDGRLREDRTLCFELLEPVQGSFPPPVMAGNTPAVFDEDMTRTAAWTRMIRARGNWTIPGGFFGTAIIHRSKFVLWPLWADPYSCNDISWMWETHLAHPDLKFGRMPGNCLYHFVKASVTAYGIVPPEDTGDRFLTRYGITIDEAYKRIYRHSESHWEG